MRATLLFGTLLSATLIASAASADPPAPPPPADGTTPPATDGTPPPPPPPATPAATPPPAPLAPPAPEAAPAPAPPAGLTVHVESPTPASLEHRVTPTSPWENVCSTPCDVAVSPGEQYRVLGTDVAPSDAFVFDGTKGNTAKVVPGSLRKARVGLWLMGGGGVLAVAGVLTLVGASTMSGFESDGTMNEGRLGVLTTGAVLLIGGLGLGAWGAGYWWTNSHSEVGGAVRSPEAKPAEKLPAPAAAFTFPLMHVDF